MGYRLLILIFCFQLVGTGNASADKFTDQDYKRHLAKLKTKMPRGVFHTVIQKPFVVIGNGSKADLERWSEGAIKWAVERLKQQYFKQDPRKIVDIWLFKDKQSYEENCELIVGYKPNTPFGFYAANKNVILMNISTGGGTLVHEIVHPFIESNFPDCPSWFNEGLASLYEQCKDNHGQIWGLTNWRLRNLQFEIESKSLPTIQELCSTSTIEFYKSDSGDNYAQARYLCYYLQEKKLLNKFYHQFNRDVAEDPTGFKTLKSVIGIRDINAFEKRWHAYCLKLRF